MKIIRIVLLSIVLTGTFHSTPVVADDSCTEWTRQDDGTYWHECVDANGHRYCEQKDAKGKITQVPC